MCEWIHFCEKWTFKYTQKLKKVNLARYLTFTLLWNLNHLHNQHESADSDAELCADMQPMEYCISIQGCFPLWLNPLELGYLHWRVMVVDTGVNAFGGKGLKSSRFQSSFSFPWWCPLHHSPIDTFPPLSPLLELRSLLITCWEWSERMTFSTPLPHFLLQKWSVQL